MITRPTGAPVPPIRICSKCGEPKTIDCFNRISKVKGTFRSICRQCDVHKRKTDPNHFKRL